jgi:hypothetical protein
MQYDDHVQIYYWLMMVTLCAALLDEFGDYELGDL